MQPVARMRRLLSPQPQAAVAEPCGFCDAPAGEQHGHVVDLQNRGLLCVCRPCYLLFTSPGAAQGRYHAVPDRYRRASRAAISDAQWDEFGIPVGIAFFFRHSGLGRTVAFYPSPAGATEHALPPTADSLLQDLEPDVEALLVRRMRGQSDAFFVPIDACYELVGLVKRHWRGFDGGERAWSEIDAFFDRMRRRAS